MSDSIYTAHHPTSPDDRPEVFTITHEGRGWSFWTAPVDLTTLRFSVGTQRSFSRSFVDRLKGKFFPPAMHIVIAVYPDGTQECVGGHHCATAARELGYTQWPKADYARVKDEVEAAEFCRALLETRSVGSADAVAIDVQAGNPTVLAHIDLLRSAGRDWKKERRTQETWNTFNVITATQWVERRVGAEALKEQLEFANECWPDQREVCHNDVVKGIYHLFRDWRTGRGKFPKLAIQTALKTGTLKEILSKAETTVPQRQENQRGRFAVENKAQHIARLLADDVTKKSNGMRLAYSPPVPGKKKR